ncbi:MAG: NAD-dependent epimerase/dehydratase family protein, partial [Myxococcota bacterium]
MNIVAVTGATGFVGSALCSALAGAHRVRRLLRAPASPRDGCEDIVVGDLADAALDAACQGAEAVIHLAARTHVMREHAADAEAAYRRINVEGTRRLAEAAVRAGVRRCVFLSSIKVNGEATHGAPYTEAS